MAHRVVHDPCHGTQLRLSRLRRPFFHYLVKPRKAGDARYAEIARALVLSHLAAHGEQPQRWANRYCYWSTRKLHCQPGLFGRTFSHSLASPWLVLHWIFVSELLGVVCRTFACVSQTNSWGFARRCCALDSLPVSDWQRKKSLCRRRIWDLAAFWARWVDGCDLCYC